MINWMDEIGWNGSCAHTHEHTSCEKKFKIMTLKIAKFEICPSKDCYYQLGAIVRNSGEYGTRNQEKSDLWEQRWWTQPSSCKDGSPQTPQLERIPKAQKGWNGEGTPDLPFACYPGLHLNLNPVHNRKQGSWEIWVSCSALSSREG